MILNLIAIDPGGETGLAWATYRPGAVHHGTKIPVHRQIALAFERNMGGWLQIIGPLNEQCIEIQEHIRDILKKSGAEKQTTYTVRTIVVIEDFSLHPSGMYTANVLSPVKLGAKLEFYFWLEELDIELEWAQPGEQQVITDNNLRKWGLWVPGNKADDAMTAVKHLIVRARKHERER